MSFKAIRPEIGSKAMFWLIYNFPEKDRASEQAREQRVGIQE